MGREGAADRLAAGSQGEEEGEVSQGAGEGEVSRGAGQVMAAGLLACRWLGDPAALLRYQGRGCRCCCCCGAVLCWRGTRPPGPQGPARGPRPAAGLGWQHGACCCAAKPGPLCCHPSHLW